MSLTVLNVSYNQLSGFLTPGLSLHFCKRLPIFLFCFVTGPPLHETIKLLSPLTNLEELNLSCNKIGGTITSDVAVLTKLKKLELYNMGLDGEIGSTRTERLRMLLTFLFTGNVPKDLPVPLEVLNLGDDPFATSSNKFTGGIPSEWGVLTNLKGLKMVNCGLDGKPLSTRTERLMLTLTFPRLLQGGCLMILVSLPI